MSRIIHRLAALTLLAVSFAVAVNASPAAAAPPVLACTPYKQETVCVQRSGWSARGYLADRDASDGRSVVRGGNDLVVALLECHGDGSNCVPVAAVHDFVTPWRPMIPGHTYRTVSSWVHVAPGPEYAAVSIFSPYTYRPCPC